MKDLSIANVKPNHKLITLGKQWYYLKQKLLTCPDWMEDEITEQMEKVEKKMKKELAKENKKNEK